MLGCTTPRLWTPPLRELTPATSFGFEIIDWARDMAGEPLDLWQEWAVIHAGELLPNGLPRFRIVLVIVARQNGKTHLLKIVASWWLHADLPGLAAKPLVLGTSSKLDYARESWSNLVDLTYAVPDLRAECGPRRRAVREANGEQTLKTLHGTRYKIAAANADAGRSMTVHRLVLDELRQHDSWTAYNAAEPTTSTIPDAQIWGLSNAGLDSSVVLNSLRDRAVQEITDGATADTDLCLIEYSAPDGADPEDVDALAQANPNLGRRKPLAPLLRAARRAKAAGGEQLAGFKNEHMCIRERVGNPAIDLTKWAECGADGIDLALHRARVALALDVALDGLHATIVAAALLDDDLVHVDPVRAWSGPACTAMLRAALPDVVRQVRPRVVGWLPTGPAASVAAALAERAGRKELRWPPAGVKLAPITTELAAVCMGLAELVKTSGLRHPRSPLLDAHVESTERRYVGDRWIFERRRGPDGAPVGGPIDGTYATAAAVHLARTLPPALGKPRIITSPAGR